LRSTAPRSGTQVWDGRANPASYKGSGPRGTIPFRNLVLGLPKKTSLVPARTAVRLPITLPTGRGEAAYRIQAEGDSQAVF